MAGEAEAAVNPRLEDWPPAEAAPLDVAALYAGLSARGLDYGPVFRGLTGAWRLGNVIYGQVALPAGRPMALGTMAFIRRYLMRRCMSLPPRTGLMARMMEAYFFRLRGRK